MSAAYRLDTTPPRLQAPSLQNFRSRRGAFRLFRGQSRRNSVTQHDIPKLPRRNRIRFGRGRLRTGDAETKDHSQQKGESVVNRH